MKKVTLMVSTVVLLVLLSNWALASSVDSNDQIILTFEGAAISVMTLGEFLDLEQKTVTLTRTNSRGKTTTGTYKGVHWTELAEAVGASNAKSVLVVASDGFEQAYPLEVLTAPNSLFAIYQDDQPITKEAQNGRIWFCASEEFTANYWTKFIVKVVVR